MTLAPFREQKALLRAGSECVLYFLPCLSQCGFLCEGQQELGLDTDFAGPEVGLSLKGVVVFE